MIKLLLVSDLHGSNACFRKLSLLVGEVCPDLVVVAGDWSGKRVGIATPVGRGFSCRIAASDLITEGDADANTMSEAELDAQLQEWGNIGIYGVRVDNAADLKDLEKISAQATVRRLTQWLDYWAQSHPDLPLFSIPGNDDSDLVVQVLATHQAVTYLSEAIISHRGYEFFGFGYSNETPWKTRRELKEPEIAIRLRSLCRKIINWSRAIGVIHVPPFHSGLDIAPALVRDSDGHLRAKGSEWVSVGSTSVRDVILECRPVAVLSGHCHSARGARMVGTTVCVNAGSAFQVGILWALLLIVQDNEVVQHQHLVR